MKHQIILSGREAFSFQQENTIRVVKGTAWVSEAGCDFVLLAGDQFKAQPTHVHSQDKIVISPARGNAELVIEIVGAAKLLA